ncbi:hypothetical protein KKC16_03345, partial [Patescibacteria group bacterium]|nr:hypothetical protein [Patescibacteria group bacterium]
MLKHHGSIDDLFSSSKKEPEDESARGKFKKRMAQINLKDLEEETKKQAQKMGMSYINLIGFPVTSESLTAIPEAEAKKLSTVCFYLDQEKIRIGSMNPMDDAVQKKLKELKKRYYVNNAETYLLSPHSFDYCIELYKNLPQIKPIPPGVEITEKDLKKFKKEIDNLENLNEKINEIS